MLQHQGLNGGQMALESVATILERTVPTTIQDWYERAVLDERLMAVSMSRELRCSHLRRIFCDLVFVSGLPRFPAKKELFSEDVAERGVARRKQGYSPR
jgi:hypothetical protein